MKYTTVLTIVFAAILVAGVMTPASASGSFGADSQQVGDLEADLVTITTNVSETGTAEFQIRYAIRLTDQNETEAFEGLATDIQENTSVYLGRFSDRMNATVEAAESATGRSMAIGDFAVSTNTTAGIDRQYGLVTYSASWSGFAAVSDEKIYIGDALEGLFLDAETELQIQWDSDYELGTVEPAPTESTNTSVSWVGPLEFLQNEPSVTLTTATDEPTTETPTATTTEPPADEGGVPWLLLIVGIGVLFLLGGGWFWRTSGGSIAESGATGGGESAESGTGTTAEPSPPPELLSNEERVEQYLDSVGGRAKQQEIIDALEWTEAKASQVLSEMSEDDRIEKFRIGRENVVKIPDSDGQTE
ncbi:DUF7343 domain-containing protein [Halodesulfurarchaeum sp.]|uniref:DUF7343 domain-containing protein n=1 Tax=Halodesulfurarchaeum sp. TaxID=1980530 RepID=UPI002FC3B701